MDVYQLQSRVRSDFFRNSKLDQVGHLWKVIALEGTCRMPGPRRRVQVYIRVHIYGRVTYALVLALNVYLVGDTRKESRRHRRQRQRLCHVCYGIGFECLSSGRHPQGE